MSTGKTFEENRLAMRYQHFHLPAGFDPNSRPMKRSPWYHGEYVMIPREAWEKILNYAFKHYPVLEAVLQKLSRGEAENRFLVDPSEMDKPADLPVLMRALEEELYGLVEPVEEFVPRAGDPHLAYEEYGNMMAWVSWVIGESVRLGQPFVAYID